MTPVLSRLTRAELELMLVATEKQRDSLDEELEDTLDKVTSLRAEIAELNRQLRQREPEPDPDLGAGQGARLRRPRPSKPTPVRKRVAPCI